MSPINRILRHKKQGQPSCPICNEPVSLETSKTDEDGQATHEECYVSKVCGRNSPKPAGDGKKTGTAG